MVPIDGETPVSEPARPEFETQPNRAGWDRVAQNKGRLLGIAIVAGLLAGLASSLAGESIMSHYQSALVPAIEAHPAPGSMQGERDARLYSSVLSFTAMGGVLGLAMGLAGGLASRSVFAGLAAGISALLLGAAAAASISYVLVSNFFKSRVPESTDLVLPLLTHGAIWSAVGVIGGLAFGLGAGGKGRWKATVLGGLVGAAAATIVYEIVGAVAFASSKTDLPLAGSSTTRGMAQLLVAILTAGGAGVAYLEAMQRESQSREPSLAPSGQDPRA
jgi:hypothetical protein